MAFETSTVRQGIAGFLSVNGQQFSCSRLIVTQTGTRTSDTFSAEIPIDAKGGSSETFWASQDSIEAEAIISVGGQQQSLVKGSADEISIDWINRSVLVTGRDGSSALSQTRINTEYVNKTSAEIVQDIAQNAGLEAKIGSLNGDDVSKKYDIDTVHLILNRTPFEAISILAEREGVRWYVSGNTLHFGDDDESGGSYQIEYRPPQGGYMTANAVRLTTKRNLVAAQTAESTATAWNQKDKTRYTSTATANGAHGSQKAILGYNMHYPGMNQQEVETLARTRAEETIRHEMCIEVNMPGDPSLDVTQKVTLTGTGTVFDQDYDIDELVFTFEAGEDGFFSMDIVSKSSLKGRKVKTMIGG